MSNNTLQRFDSIEFAKNLPEATLENPRPDTFNDNVKELGVIPGFLSTVIFGERDDTFKPNPREQ